MEYEIAFFEAFEEEAAALRRALGEGVRAWFSERTIQDCGPGGMPAPVVSVRTQSRIPLAWAGDLEAILTRSTGYDHVVRYRAEAGREIPAAHLPLYCNRAVAEHALLVWTALLRKFPLQQQAFASFSRDGLTGSEVRGRTLAVFGVGNIGSEVVDIGRGLRMRVLGIDPVRRLPDLDYVDKASGLAEADVLLCAMNLNASNAGYFDDEAWSRVRPGAVFVNIARGEMAPFAALLRALRGGRLAGIGLDVYNEEPNVAGFLRQTGFEETPELAAFRALRQDPRVLLTPHNAFNTTESVERKAVQTVEQYREWRAHGRFTTPVPGGP